MGIRDKFRKSKKEASQAASVPDDGAKGGRKLGRKVKGEYDYMTDRFRLNNPSKSLSLMRENPNFAMHFSEGNAYACIILDVDDVGGFSGGKNLQNEAKGSFIESISGRHIHTYTTEEKLKQGKVLIIPNEITLDTLGDYTASLFPPDFGFRWAIVDESGNIMEIADERISLHDLMRISEGELDIMNVLDVHTEDLSSEEIMMAGRRGGADSASASLLSDEDALDELEGDMEIIDDLEDIEDDDEDIVDVADDDEDIVEAADEPVDDIEDVPDEIVEDEVPYEIAAAAFEESAGEPADEVVDELVEEAAEEPAYEEEESFSEVNIQTSENVDDILRSRIRSRDIDFNFDSSAFDERYGRLAPLTIPVPSGDGWLDENVAAKTREANALIEEMHANNFRKARDHFMRLMHDSVNKVRGQTALDEGLSNPYAREAANIEGWRAQSVGRIDDIVEERQHQLDQDFEKLVEEYAQNAAAHARDSYRERNGLRHDAEKKAVRRKVESDIEASYQENMNALVQKAQRDADTKMNDVLEACLRAAGDMYESLVADENEMAEKMRQSVESLRLSHMDAEATRIRVAENEQSNSTRLSNLKSDFELRLEVLEQEKKDIEARHKAKLEALRAEHSEDLDRAKELHAGDLDAQIRRYDKLQSDYADLTSRVDAVAKDEERKAEARYGGEIASLKSQNAALQNRLDDSMKMSQRHSKQSAGLAVAAAVASLAVGALGGVAVGHALDGDSDKAPAVEQTVEAPAPSTGNGVTYVQVPVDENGNVIYVGGNQNNSVEQAPAQPAAEQPAAEQPAEGQ